MVSVGFGCAASFIFEFLGKEALIFGSNVYIVSQARTTGGGSPAGPAIRAVGRTDRCGLAGGTVQTLTDLETSQTDKSSISIYPVSLLPHPPSPASCGWACRPGTWPPAAPT